VLTPHPADPCPTEPHPGADPRPLLPRSPHRPHPTTSAHGLAGHDQGRWGRARRGAAGAGWGRAGWPVHAAGWGEMRPVHIARQGVAEVGEAGACCGAGPGGRHTTEERRGQVKVGWGVAG
jgi:hypothetical protein